MDKIDISEDRCDSKNAVFWGAFPEEVGKQERHSATVALYQNSEDEWFTIRRGKAVAPRDQPPLATREIAPTHAYILTPDEASEFLDDILRPLRDALNSL